MIYIVVLFNNVVLFLTSAHIPVTRLVTGAPRGHQLENWLEALSVAGKRVLDVRRNLRVNLAIDDAVAFQFSQMLRQHLFRQAGNKPLQFAKTSRLPFKVKQQYRFPLASNDGSGQLHWAILVIHGVPTQAGYRNVPTGKKDTFP